MKKKNLVLLSLFGTGIFVSAIATTSALNTNQSKAEIISELTGKTVEEIVTIKEEQDKTYGEIAKENDVLEEFKEENMEMFKARVQERVKNGSITPEEGEEMIQNREQRQADCNGDGLGRQGANQGLGQGMRHNQCNGECANKAS